MHQAHGYKGEYILILPGNSVLKGKWTCIYLITTKLQYYKQA